ncbi:histidinol-phosphate transaminase [Candidatus Peregrinibacteria bacterium]|nr:histidinol-phosphate transaminase [Candidatus Peregrinibacteria bacterium]
MKSLVRPNIRKLRPYVCARNLYQEGILLDANENAFADDTQALNRYPDPESKKLRTALAVYAGVKTENIFAGVGSDEIIDLLIRIFAAPREEIIVLEPTYGMYQVVAQINDVKLKPCLLTENFQPDLRKIRKCISPKTKMLFCASPNSPTGNLLNPSDLKKLCAIFPGIIVIDEAYIEFSSQPSFAENLRRFKNLVILRTLSKAWGLAGIRVGYCIANPLIIEYLMKIKPPYNMNSVSASLAEKALKNKENLAELRQKMMQERTRLSHELKKLGATVFPSEANFLLVKIPSASSIIKKLAEDFTIIVRDFSSRPLLKDCFRVTVGTREENRAFIQSLTTFL